MVTSATDCGRLLTCASFTFLSRSLSMSLSPEQLDATVVAGQQNALAELAALCAIPSVSAKGQALEPCAELVADHMRAHGLEARIMPTEGGPPIVLGEAAADRADAPTV